jgi:hypothetical protein
VANAANKLAIANDCLRQHWSDCGEDWLDWGVGKVSNGVRAGYEERGLERLGSLRKWQIDTSWFIAERLWGQLHGEGGDGPDCTPRGLQSVAGGLQAPTVWAQ